MKGTPVTDDVFESLAAALKDCFSKSFRKLPKDLRVRVKHDFFGLEWDTLTEKRREAVAARWDYEHDPATAAERERDLATWNEYHEAKREVAKWEAAATPTASDQATRDDRLKEAMGRLATLTDRYKQLRGDYVGRDQSAPAQKKETQTRVDALGAEIEQAIRELGGDRTPYQVMSKLRSYAEKSGSCISEAGGDYVLWRSASGDLQKLDMKNLRSRLTRRAQRLANTSLIPR